MVPVCFKSLYILHHGYTFILDLSTIIYVWIWIIIYMFFILFLPAILLFSPPGLDVMLLKDLRID